MAGTSQCCTVKAQARRPTTSHVSWTELSCRLERVLSVSPEKLSEMEAELIWDGTAETGPFEASLQALKDFGFWVD
jgi:hypothetical protein